MAALKKGITKNGTGYSGKTWNILGQVYFPKAVTDLTFAFETNSDPGQFVPVHIHPTQEEFILVQDGILDLKLDGVWVKAHAGDLGLGCRAAFRTAISTSRDKPARALFWVSLMQKLEALFNQLHNLTDVAEIVRISGEHEVNFLPPEANESTLRVSARSFDNDERSIGRRRPLPAIEMAVHCGNSLCLRLPAAESCAKTY